MTLTIKFPKNSGVVKGKNLATNTDLMFIQTLILRGSDITAYILGFMQEAADFFIKKLGNINNIPAIAAAYPA